jgi:small conductance mechanosensitive channel
VNKSVKERFDKEGIEIPFPYRTVVYKKDLPKNG